MPLPWQIHYSFIWTFFSVATSCGGGIIWVEVRGEMEVMVWVPGEMLTREETVFATRAASRH